MDGVSIFMFPEHMRLQLLLGIKVSSARAARKYGGLSNYAARDFINYILYTVPLFLEPHKRTFICFKIAMYLIEPSFKLRYR